MYGLDQALYFLLWNNLQLHRLANLGEPTDSNLPQFIMLQTFLSKTKPDIQKHLVLKVAGYKDLLEIKSQNQGHGKGFCCHHCNFLSHMKQNCLEKTRKNNGSTNPHQSKEVSCLWNKHQRSPCTLQDQSCKYDRLHKGNTCSEMGCKEINHKQISLVWDCLVIGTSWMAMAFKECRPFILGWASQVFLYFNSGLDKWMC